LTLLIIGLGNPGLKYQGSRHNTGFDVIDIIASKFGVKFKKQLFKPYYFCDIKNDNNRYILIKPNTYMNRSGEIIPHLLNKYNLTNDNIVIVVDNLDIKPGLLKFKIRGSDGGHNGLKSVNDYLGTTEYKRLFVGIDRPNKGVSIADYVLSQIDNSSVFEAEQKAAIGILKLPYEKISQVTNYINRRQSD